MRRDPTFVDLFCGAGLFSEGFCRQGFRPVFAGDLDKKAIASYRRNVADVAETYDVEKVKIGIRADVLIAGPPCQGFSTLGRQDPRDHRNRLSLVVPEWAAEARAKVVVIENVPPYLESPTWAQMCKLFSDLGYELEYFVLNAYEFGTPQYRERAFTIATKIGRVGAPVPSGNGADVRTAIIETPFRENDSMHIWPKPSALAGDRFNVIPQKGGKRDVIAARPDLCPPSWFKMKSQATDVWGRMNPDRPANTLRCTFQNPSKGRYIHPYENRVLSLREGARLQGVPDCWTFEGEPYPIARQIGNGVPIPLGQAIAGAVRSAMLT